MLNRQTISVLVSTLLKYDGACSPRNPVPYSPSDISFQNAYFFRNIRHLAMAVPDTIALIFEPTLRVAGETIRGEVHLYFPGLIKDNLIEVYVKLRGSVYT